jgi:hypothetical protein
MYFFAVILPNIIVCVCVCVCVFVNGDTRRNNPSFMMNEWYTYTHKLVCPHHSNFIKVLCFEIWYGIQQAIL